MAVQVQIRPRFREVIELNRWDWNQRIKGYLATGLGAFMIIMSASMWLSAEKGPDPIHGVLAGAMFVFIGLIATRVAGAGAWVRGAWRPYLVELSTDGVAVTPEGKERAAVGWEVFKPYYETPNLLVLPVRAGGGPVAIPKRCCGGEQLAELRGLLAQTRLPASTPS